MNIACKKCGTVYKIAGNAIGDDGKKVKCIKCGNLWRAKKDEIFHFVKKEPKIATTHAIKKNPYNFKPASIIVTALLLFMICIGYYHDEIKDNYPASAAFYEAFNVIDFDEMQLENVFIYQTNQLKSLKGAIISGDIHNYGSVSKKAPDLRITILDWEKKPIATHTIKGQNIIKPDETFKFNNKIKSFPQNTEYIMLDIGNWLDLKLR